jgi:phosphoglycolate phosphatase
MPDQFRASAKVQLAVLDLAGTTVVDTGVVERAFEEALAHAGVAGIDHQKLVPLRGMAKADMFGHVTDDPDQAAAGLKAFNEIMVSAAACGELPASPGATELLARLRNAGIKACLMTGFSSAIVDSLLDHLGWRDLVDLTVAHQQGGLRGRPYPDLILHALTTLRVDSVQSVAVVGDTANDLLAGARSGASRVVGILGGAHDRERLEAAPHTDIVENLTEFGDLLLEG